MSTDPPLIMQVSAETRPGALAGAICQELTISERVVLSAIGPHAVNQAIKAVASARGRMVSNGFELVVVPSFAQPGGVVFDHTGMRLLVRRERQ